MKRNYPLVRSAPRCAEELAEVSLEVQLNILVELRSLSSGGLMSAKKFSGLSKEDRARYLEEALQDYDKATAYTVHGIAMPIRTVDDEKNQQAWKDFAVRVEEAVTELSREDCKQISTNYLDGGVLIVGYRPPKEQLDPFALGPRVIAVPIPRASSSGQSEVGEALTRLMSELAALSTHGHTAGAKEVEEVIDRFFQGKSMTYLQEAIKRVEGVAESMEKNPEVPKSISSHMLPYLRRILSVLKGRISLQLC